MTLTDPSSIRTILVATANPDKFREIVAVLSGEESGWPPVRWLSLGDLDRAVSFLQEAERRAPGYHPAAVLAEALRR